MFRLQVTELTKRFGARRVFKNIAFEISTGEILALVGPNGSGKTTLLLTLLGEYRPSKGSVLFAGTDGVLGEDDIRTRSALVAPYMNLYDSLTAEENLSFFAGLSGVHRTGKEINSILNRVGLEGRSGDLTGSYSSGMKQRLKFALALAIDPDYLFLDEPTTNLDESGKTIIYDIVADMQSHAVVVMATNEAEDQKFAQQFCRLGQ